MLENLAIGFSFVFQPFTFLMLVFGVVFGVIVGALPGITGSLGIILLLPLVSQLDSKVAMVMLCGLFSSSMFGGSISAILIRTPGGASAAATMIDGYPLAQKGYAGKAIGVAAIASFIGGIISTACLILIAPQLSKVALQFHGADYFSLAVFGLSMIGGSSGKNVVKGLISGVFGMFIATVGIDSILGTTRFTFGSVSLMSGFPLLTVLIGVFAISEVLQTAGKRFSEIELPKQKLKNVLPTWKEIRSIMKVSGISGLIGVFIGIIPGTGGAISSFMAYNFCKRISKHPEEYGEGALEGIAAPESSNNGTTGGALIPMLTLGVPGDVVTSVMLGALVLIGVRPGPLIFVENAPLVYTIFSGMIVIQFVMLAISLGFARISPMILKMPQNMLMPIVMVLCVVGTFSLANQLYHVFIALIFGLVGLFMRRFGFPAAPMILGVILGPMAEANLNRALIVTKNDWTILFTRPLSLAFLIVSALFIGMTVYTNQKDKKKTMAVKEAK